MPAAIRRWHDARKRSLIVYNGLSGDGTRSFLRDRPSISHSVVIFLDEPPMRDAVERITGKNGADVQLGQREIHVQHGDGMANSKRKMPDAKAGTARTINTVSRLAAVAAEV
jgi:hypothetical protein